jgi:2-polyprenyl-3-methyl-5-hydroxy-6-metoxy-1,4-benzoquinol methylase
VLDDIKENIGNTTKQLLIFDLGCGYGNFMKMCTEKGYTCLGMEISRYALTRAIDKSIGAILGDVQSSLPLKLNSVDVVVMLDVIEHLDKPSLALEEIKKVLKPKGLLYIATPNLMAVARLLKGKNWYGFLDKTHVSLFTPFVLKGLLEKCDFEILRCYTPFNFTLFRALILKVIARFFIGGQIRLIARNGI